LIKKQIGLLAIIAFIVTFMAFSGVASAQTSNAQVVFFTSPYCSACKTAEPIVQSAAAKYGVTLVTYDVTTSPGKGIASANGVSETPTIVVSGAQSARFEGSITQAQIESAIKAAMGTTTVQQAAATPTAAATVKAATPTAAATVKAATPTAAATVKATTPTAAATVKATTPTAAATVKATTPTIQVVAPTPTTKTTTSTVPEFSVLGLGAPALLVGAIYLFLRRQ
jgi:thioredoxin-like negative regulator of GroEL